MNRNEIHQRFVEAAKANYPFDVENGLFQLRASLDARDRRAKSGSRAGSSGNREPNQSTYWLAGQAVRRGDDETAELLLRRLAERGHPEAARDLACLLIRWCEQYEHRSSPAEVDIVTIEALEWWLEAVDVGVIEDDAELESRLNEEIIPPDGRAAHVLTLLTRLLVQPRHAGPQPVSEVRAIDIAPARAIAEFFAAMEATKPDWQSKARCSQTGSEVFFPDGGDTRRAKAFCGACPVWRECLEHGLDEDHGVWGGLGRAERARLRRLQQRLQETPAGSANSVDMRRLLAVGLAPERLGAFLGLEADSVIAMARRGRPRRNRTVPSPGASPQPRATGEASAAATRRTTPDPDVSFILGLLGRGYTIDQVALVLGQDATTVVSRLRRATQPGAHNASAATGAGAQDVAEPESVEDSSVRATAEHRTTMDAHNESAR